MSNNDVVHRIVKRENPEDYIRRRAFFSSNAAGRIPRIQSDKTFGRNTWNVHVILTRVIRSVD